MNSESEARIDVDGWLPLSVREAIRKGDEGPVSAFVSRGREQFAELESSLAACRAANEEGALTLAAARKDRERAEETLATIQREIGEGVAREGTLLLAWLRGNFPENNLPHLETAGAIILAVKAERDGLRAAFENADKDRTRLTEALVAESKAREEAAGYAARAGDLIAKADAERDALRAERDRLATDALCALSAAGIATPEKGYAAEPHVLTANIQTLARERDTLKAERDALRLDVARAWGEANIVKQGEIDTTRSQVRALQELLGIYVLQFAGIHTIPDCPEDGPCECPLVRRVNEMLAHSVPVHNLGTLASAAARGGTLEAEVQRLTARESELIEAADKVRLMADQAGSGWAAELRRKDEALRRMSEDYEARGNNWRAEREQWMAERDALKAEVANAWHAHDNLSRARQMDLSRVEAERDAATKARDEAITERNTHDQIHAEALATLEAEAERATTNALATRLREEAEVDCWECGHRPKAHEDGHGRCNACGCVTLDGPEQDATP